MRERRVSERECVVYEALSYSVCGLKLLGYEGLRYYCTRLKLLVYEVFSY